MDATNKILSAMIISTAAAVVLALGACSGAQGVPSADSMPDGASYSGLWYSEQFEHMYLHQDGDRVEGVYTYGGGGLIEGEIDGNLLLFSWEEPGSRQTATRDMDGQGYFQLLAAGDQIELSGEWGYNDDRRGAGPWEAEFIRELEDDDPLTIEELESHD